MTTQDINRMPLRKQFAIVAHIYRLEITELARLLGSAFAVFVADAERMVMSMAYYHRKHRHQPRHR